MRSVLATLATAVALLVGAAAAQAQTFTVTNTSDSGAVGDGSLRGELKSANLAAGPDTVAFVPGLSGTIALTGGALTIKGGVAIEGPGAGQLTVAETPGSGERVFTVDEATNGEAVTIASLHIANGTAPNSGLYAGAGGDVLNRGGSLTLANDLLTGGEAATDGGGVASYQHPLTVISSVVRENGAIDLGGGISATAPFSIIGTTVSANSAQGRAGLELFAGGSETGLVADSAIFDNTGAEGAYFYALEHGHITVRDSTFADNPGHGLQLGTHEGGTIAIIGSTVAGNHSAAAGGGIWASVGSASTIEDTIVAENTGAAAPDVSGPLAASFSLLGSAAGATLTEPVPGSNLLDVEPQLGLLADNGGPTETMALPPNSPAVNKGSAFGLTSDQRGLIRPVLYPGVPISSAPGADGSDIGAYELQAPAGPPPPVLIQPAPLPSPAPANPAPRVRVSCPRSAKPGGCHFALQVFSAKPHKHKGQGKRHRPKPPVAESAVAKVKLAPGRSAVVTLEPKAKYAAELGAAKNLLVREVETVKGMTQTAYRRLKVIG